MPSLSYLQSKLTEVQARLDELRAVYPKIIQYKGYTYNFSEVGTTYQEFKSVSDEYERLLNREERLTCQIDEIQGNDTGGSFLAGFR